MVFKAAKLDRLASIISTGITALLLAMSIFFIMKVPYGWIFAIVMVAIIVISYLLAPKQYYFEGMDFVIEKNLGKKIIIKLQKIKAYTLIPNFMKLKIARTFGNGGLFGYYGIFSSAEFGNINCQLTRLKNIYLIKTDRGNYAVSPAEPEHFEQELKARLSNLSIQPEELKPTPLEKHKAASLLILLLPLILFILIVISVFLNYAQMPDRIAVHFDAHGTPDRWGPKSSYLFSGLIPSSILFLLTIGIFFFVRSRTNNPAIPNFLVVIVSFIQLFIAYTTFDTFWVNKYGSHIMPIFTSLIIFVIIIVLLLTIYYRVIAKKSGNKM